MTSLWLSRGGIFSLWHSFYYWISFNKSYHLFYFEIQSNQRKNCKYLTEWLSELKAPDWVSLVIMFQTSSQWPSHLSFASSLLSLFCCIQQVFFQLKLSQGLTLVSSYSYQLNWQVLLQSWLPYHPLHSFWDNFQVLTQVLSQLLAKFLSSFSGGSVRSYSTLLIIKKATLVIAMYFPWFKLNLQTIILSSLSTMKFLFKSLRSSPSSTGRKWANALHKSLRTAFTLPLQVHADNEVSHFLKYFSTSFSESLLTWSWVRSCQIIFFAFHLQWE